jgi:hypothetical protein
VKADSRSVWVPLIVATAFAWSAMACSAGEDNKDPAPGTGGKPGAAGAAGAGATPGAAGAGIDVPGQGGAGNKPPPSKEVGTEALPCNGVDDNDNGIIDDIDVGKDGVCDCLSIAVFGNSGKEADNSSFATWLKARGSREPVYIDAEAALTAEALKGIHVLVVQDLSLHPEVSDAEVKALTDWVNAGGGVMTMSGYQAVPSDATMTNALLANTGLSYDISMGGAGVLGGGAPPLRLPAIVDPKHPLTAGITLVGVYYAYPVQGDGTEIF